MLLKSSVIPWHVRHVPQMVNIDNAETSNSWSCPVLAPTVTYKVAGGKFPFFAKNVSISPGMTFARSLSMTATVSASEHTITPAPRAVCESTFLNMIDLQIMRARYKERLSLQIEQSSTKISIKFMVKPSVLTMNSSLRGDRSLIKYRFGPAAYLLQSARHVVNAWACRRRWCSPASCTTSRRSASSAATGGTAGRALCREEVTWAICSAPGAALPSRRIGRLRLSAILHQFVALRRRDSRRVQCGEPRVGPIGRASDGHRMGEQ